MTAYGQKASIALCFQNSYGTSNVASLHFIPYISESVGLDKPPLVSENMRGIFDEGDDYEGPNMVTGDLVAEAQPIALGAMLAAVLGKPSTVTSTGIYTHTFKPRTSDFGTYAANVPVTYLKDLNDGGSASLFQDLNGSTLELGIAQGEFLKATVGFVGGKDSQIAAVAASYETGKRWTWNVASLSIGGTAKPEAMDLTVKVDEALEAQHTLSGSKYPSRIKRTGMRTIEVSGTIKFDSQTEYQAFLAQSERSMVMTLTGPTEIQSGYYETLTIKTPALRWRELKPVVGGPGQIEASVSGTGKYLTTSATALEMVLVNTLAGY